MGTLIQFSKKKFVQGSAGAWLASSVINFTRSFIHLYKNEISLLKVDRGCMKRIVTSHRFGMLYYASPVGLNKMTLSRIWTLLNSVHLKGLQVAVTTKGN